MINIIYTRDSPDWKNIKNIDEFMQANENSRPLVKSWLPELKEAIDLWNKAFRLNYFEFRASLKEITTSNIATVANAFLINKQKINQIREQEDFILYMIDDDDFVIPNLFDNIGNCENIDCCVWPFGFLRDYMKITNIHIPIHGIKYIYSNNCVITKKGYDKLLLKSTPESFLEDHREVDELFCQYKDTKYKILNTPLSVYNHSPASATKMWSVIYKKQSIFSLIEKYKQVPIIDKELDWSLPYIKSVWQLINSLAKKSFL